MKAIIELAAQEKFRWSDIVRLLSIEEQQEIEIIRKKAEETLLHHCGNKVFYRGLIEFSNECINNCYYCGIRKNNRKIKRYRLTKEEVIDAALWCASQGYGSVVLQSGESHEEEFIAFIEDCIKVIKARSRSAKLADGLGVTLSLGEQSRQSYERLFAAGAHRYLLRIETSSPDLYAKIHGKNQSFDARKECIEVLREVGFQVGTGVMIGLPGQTAENLADDILFFKEMDVDMIGMGPYIPHHETPMGRWNDKKGSIPRNPLQLALLMIAVTRLVLKDVNIASTTALQALDPLGREKGLRFGANVIMPQLTPARVRRDYLLYDGKPCLDETAEQCKSGIEERIQAAGRIVGYNEWGDSRHMRRI